MTHTGGLRIAYVGQHDALDPKATIRHELVRDKPDHEWLADARFRDIIAGLFGSIAFPGFPDGMDTRSARCPAASGGGSRWPRR